MIVIQVMDSKEKLVIQFVAAPVRDQVVRALRSAIAGGRFQPGQRLPERELCEVFGTSRTTVREALRHLESDGLIEVIPAKGSVVRTLEVNEVEDLYLLRESLERLAVRLFIERHDDEAVRDLQEAYVQLRTAYESENVDIIMVAKDDFYKVLYRGARSNILESVAERIAGQTARLRRLSLAQGGRLQDSLREVDDLVRAIVIGDEERAELACASHVKNAARSALAYFMERERALAVQ